MINITILYFFYSFLRYFVRISVAGTNTPVNRYWPLLSWYNAMDEYWYLYVLLVIYFLFLYFI